MKQKRTKETNLTENSTERSVSSISIIFRQFMEFVGHLGGSFVVYGLILSFDYTELKENQGVFSQNLLEIIKAMRTIEEKLLNYISVYLTLGGVLITCLTAYFYKGNPQPPAKKNKIFAAPIIIIVCIASIISFTITGNISPLILNGLAIMGLTGAFFRIQPSIPE